MQTVLLTSDFNRTVAAKLCRQAPEGSVCKITAPRRSNAQNERLWACLSEISRAKPGGRNLPPEKWKALFMDAAGLKAEWQPSLDGTSVVCTGYRSSRLVKAEFSDLLEQVNAFAAENAIELQNSG